MSAPRAPGAGCERVQGRLEELLDGGLAPLEAARDEGHLEACAGCARERAAWLSLLGAARSAGRPDPAELAFALAGLEARLPPAGRPRRAARPRRLELVSLGTAAAALCALFALEQGGFAPSVDADLLGSLPVRLERPAPALPDWTGLFRGVLGGGGER